MESIADRATGAKVLEALRRSLRVDWRDYAALIPLKEDGSPFAVLIAIILSQNTNDKNAIAAYRRLRSMVGVRPEDVLSAPREVIEEAIRTSGMYRQKAGAIIGAAKAIMKAGGEEALETLPPEEVRRILEGVRGIGRKTVDVFLNVTRGVDVFAVDTHAQRIAWRWGLAPRNASYEKVSSALASFFRGQDLGEAHRLLIALGRSYCTARRPRCRECPLREVCPYPSGESRSAGQVEARG
ncbi:MAG: endonuclease III [Desulfurococcales archaeon]|nr:endonuclease III [Desulfurococcales archaeon]